jgi:hypothetical protein
MTDWQVARGLEPTGVLTTRQRAQLLDEYETEIARLGYAQVTDAAAGIDVVLPMGMVAFEDYNFPFARYTPINDSGLTILLISQPGDRATLFGLYEIMQTLEIVPLDGERERRSDSFLLTGQSATLRSHTEARVTAGAVKGFSLIWEPERDEDVAQILPRIRETIDYFPGTLDPAFVPEDASRISTSSPASRCAPRTGALGLLRRCAGHRPDHDRGRDRRNRAMRPHPDRQRLSRLRHLP